MQCGKACVPDLVVISAGVPQIVETQIVEAYVSLTEFLQNDFK